MSFVLVLVAAVALVIGFIRDDSLGLIWASIGSCVVAMIFLALGMLQQRRARDAAPAARPSTPTYGPGTRTPTATESGAASAADGEVAVVPKRTVTRAPDEAEPATAATATSTEDELEPVVPITRARSATSGTRTAPTKATAAKATATKKTATATPAKKAPAATAAKKEPAKKTTGAAARAELAKVKGLGPAKQEELLRTFGSLEAIRAASDEDLVKVKGLGPSTIAEIRSSL